MQICMNNYYRRRKNALRKPPHVWKLSCTAWLPSTSLLLFTGRSSSISWGHQRHWCCQKCLVHMWCYIQPGKHLMVSQSSQHQRATAWKSPDRLVHPHDTMQRAVPGPWMQCSFTTMLPCMLCSHVRFVLCSIILCRHTRYFHHSSS